MTSYLPQPGELTGWEPVGEPDYVKGEDLFLLINGGAEIYYEYGFKQAIAVGFKNKKNPSIGFNLEIYEMQDPAAAYGVYTFKTGESGKTIDVGDEGLLEEYYLNVWKGNFLVTVIGFDSKEETLQGIMETAKVVAAKIKSKGQKPGLIHLLPGDYKEQLKPNGITYLKGNLALFNQYEFDSRDIFGLKQGVLGDYGNFRLFVFKYGDGSECRKWFESAVIHLKENPRFRDFLRMGSTFLMMDDKGTPFYIEKAEQYIFIVQGKGKEEAKGIIGKIKH
jgi:hypothetical protein